MITLQDIENAVKVLNKQDIFPPYYTYVYGMSVPTNDRWLIWLFVNELNSK